MYIPHDKKICKCIQCVYDDNPCTKCNSTMHKPILMIPHDQSVCKCCRCTCEKMVMCSCESCQNAIYLKDTTKRVIICLGGPTLNGKPGSHLQDRLEAVVREYKVGDYVIVTGARCGKIPVAEAKIMQEWLGKYNIPSHTEERAMNTIENGMYTKQMVDSMYFPADIPIVVITSSFHIARTSIIFSKYFMDRTMWFLSAKTSKIDYVVKNEHKNLAFLISNEFDSKIYSPSLISEVKCGYLPGVMDKLHEIGVKDEYGNTAMHYACSFGFMDIFVHLPKTSINAINNENMTPLHYAVINGQVEIVWELLKLGADTNIAATNHRWQGILNVKQVLWNLRENIDEVAYTSILLMFLKYEPNKHLVMIRHGESMGNNGDVSLYTPDVSLSNYGEEVCRDINYWVKKYNLLDDYNVICSPMTRTLQTATLITQDSGITGTRVIDHRITERLNNTTCVGTARSKLEKSYGTWDWSRVPELWWYKPEVNTPENPKPVEESWEVLRDRVNHSLRDLGNDKSILMVTHGGVIHSKFHKQIVARNCDSFAIPLYDNIKV